MLEQPWMLVRIEGPHGITGNDINVLLITILAVNRCRQTLELDTLIRSMLVYRDKESPRQSEYFQTRSRLWICFLFWLIESAQDHPAVKLSAHS
jgi:hypothetical protein